MGGPDANTDRLKQSISAVRASGDFPGNVLFALPQRSPDILIRIMSRYFDWYKLQRFVGLSVRPVRRWM